MPGFDARGPTGAGPMTEGGRGYCNASGAGYGCSRGYGERFGRGRGFRRGHGVGYGRARGYGGRSFIPSWAYGQPPSYPSEMNRTDEAARLKEEASYIREELESINKRIAELEFKSAQP